MNCLPKGVFSTFIAVFMIVTDSKHRCNGSLLSKRGTSLISQQSAPTGHGYKWNGRYSYPITNPSHRSITRSDRPPELSKTYCIKPQKLPPVQYEEDERGIFQGFSRK